MSIICAHFWLFPPPGAVLLSSMMWNQFPGFPHPQERPDVCIWEIFAKFSPFSSHRIFTLYMRNQWSTTEVTLRRWHYFTRRNITCLPLIGKWLLCEGKFSDCCCTVLQGKIRQKGAACLFLVALLCWCNFSCSQKEICKMLSCPMCSLL